MLTCESGRTTVVGSNSVTPTGAMITHPEMTAPTPVDLAARVAGVTRADAQHWADAEGVTNELFGSSMGSNVFVVGMAYQAGCLPVSAESIEQAIALNGVAIDANVAAFRWGRAQVAAPDAVAAAVASATPQAQRAPADLTARIEALGVDDDLAERLHLFAVELIAWGNPGVASGWLDDVERVLSAERSVAPGSTRLTAAVAANLFKLLAYKDEYEVARLMLDDGGLEAAREAAGATGRIAWKLHPPMLRALGVDSKITLGAWAESSVRLLARAKRLRGTAGDPFRWPEVRRVERALPKEYRKSIEGVLGGLQADNLDAAVAIAELPDMVRGYEDIKLANVERYRAELTRQLEAYDA